MPEIGKFYYFIAHAYYHYVGEVMRLTPGGVELRNVCQVHSCRRNWTLFFRDGFGSDTNYDVMPDGANIPLGLPWFPWHHEIPTAKR